MTALVLGIAAFAVGPVVHHLTRRHRGAIDGLEGFVLGAIGGLVLLHIMPHCVEQAGWICLAPAALGLLGPELLERLMHRAARGVHLLALGLALLGLLVHAALDGVALAGGAHGHMDHTSAKLAAAVVLHRIPVGLTIWLLLRPGRPALVPLGTLTLMAGATAAGFFTGHDLLAGISPAALGWFQSLVAGTLLHVVLHRPHAEEAEGHGGHGRSWPALVGLGVGLGLVLLLSVLH